MEVVITTTIKGIVAARAAIPLVIVVNGFAFCWRRGDDANREEHFADGRPTQPTTAIMRVVIIGVICCGSVASITEVAASSGGKAVLVVLGVAKMCAAPSSTC
jgi:hypothetical protein